MVRFLPTLLLGLFTTLAAAAAPVSSAAPSAICDVITNKTAVPASVVVGQEIEVTLTLDGRCPENTVGGSADIVLTLDRSASQRDNGTWRPSVAAAGGFLDLIDFSRHQVAIVTFSASGPFNPDPESEVNQPLSADGTAVRAALGALPDPPFLTWSTNLTAGIEAAQGELASARHRPTARPVIVLLTDGQHNATGRAPTDAAAEAKAAGTTIITIGLGVDAAAADQLRALASAPELYFSAPTVADLEAAYSAVVGAVTSAGIRELTVVDLLPPEVAYVEGSASPPPDGVQAGSLTWTIPALTRDGWAARYRVRALVTGTYATNKLAYVDYLDGDGSVATRDFPLPVITVRERYANATYLPVLYRGHCRPARPFDVVLALDTSSSMWGEKLRATREAARAFLRFLEMPPSQAAVVAFNEQATVVQVLGADRDAALAALDRLPQAEGTRIDRALARATEELTSPGRDGGNAAVIVLITDGRQTGTSDQVALDAAAAARRAGITVYTVGIGPEAAAALLVRLAGAPERYFAAPSAGDLVRIYQGIAGTLPCDVR